MLLRLTPLLKIILAAACKVSVASVLPDDFRMLDKTVILPMSLPPEPAKPVVIVTSNPEFNDA